MPSNFWRNPSVLLICFFLIVAVRFNRNDLLVKRSLGDAAFYIGNVEFLRGAPVAFHLQAPFNERLLVTIAASQLPFDPMTSINIINVIFLLTAIWFLYKLLEHFGLDDKLVWAGLYLFVISFPTFYYSTIGYVDSGVLLMIFAGTYAIYKENHVLFLLAVALGTIAKEGIVLLIPVAMAYAFIQKNTRWYYSAAAGLLLYLLVWGLVKKYIPNGHGNTPMLFWQPITWRIVDNFTRSHAYLSSILSFGIPGALCCYYVFRFGGAIKSDWKVELPLWVGTLGGYLLWFYTLFSAHTDGRFFWVAYCFPIILSLLWWRRFGKPYLG
ncbi:MAG: hypothetical protein J7619_12370 [Dyadobacter sp.]|uniref:hypothetical protein n=1 Tax=Dyadobacter sp. TaxID=1914288 RepID=UPI001B2EB000|nr:hypothetical protein [Dyadobacter sp.]MBO9613488.1 hypothetical protein [Dyadobacter sp.]